MTDKSIAMSLAPNRLKETNDYSFHNKPESKDDNFEKVLENKLSREKAYKTNESNQIKTFKRSSRRTYDDKGANEGIKQNYTKDEKDISKFKSNDKINRHSNDKISEEDDYDKVSKEKDERSIEDKSKKELQGAEVINMPDKFIEITLEIVKKVINDINPKETDEINNILQELNNKITNGWELNADEKKIMDLLNKINSIFGTELKMGYGSENSNDRAIKLSADDVKTDEKDEVNFTDDGKNTFNDNQEVVNDIMKKLKQNGTLDEIMNKDQYSEDKLNSKVTKSLNDGISDEKIITASGQEEKPKNLVEKLIDELRTIVDEKVNLHNGEKSFREKLRDIISTSDLRKEFNDANTMIHKDKLNKLLDVKDVINAEDINQGVLKGAKENVDKNTELKGNEVKEKDESEIKELKYERKNALINGNLTKNNKSADDEIAKELKNINNKGINTDEEDRTNEEREVINTFDKTGKSEKIKDNKFKENNNNIQQPNINVDNTENKMAVKFTNKTVKEPEIQKNDILNQTLNQMKVTVTEDKSEVVIKLKPETLGKLTLKVITENGVVMAKFAAESHQVKEIIEANMQILKDSLEKQGLFVQGFSVSVGGDSNENRNFSSKKEAKDGKYQKETIGEKVNTLSRNILPIRPEIINQYMGNQSQINFTA